jgi:hypothetical protein
MEFYFCHLHCPEASWKAAESPSPFSSSPITRIEGEFNAIDKEVRHHFLSQYAAIHIKSSSESLLI